MIREEIQSKLTLDSLISFLEGYDSNDMYCYVDNKECVLGRLVEAKKNGLNVFTSTVTTQERYEIVARIPAILNKIASEGQGDFKKALSLAKRVKEGKLKYDEENFCWVILDKEDELIAA